MSVSTDKLEVTEMSSSTAQPPPGFDLMGVLRQAQQVSDDFNAWIATPVTQEPAESAHHLLGRAVALLEHLIVAARPDDVTRADLW